MTNLLFRSSFNGLRKNGETRLRSSMFPATDRNGRFSPRAVRGHREGCLPSQCSKRPTRGFRRHSPSQRYENVVATLASWQLGACCVFMSPKGTDEERNHIHALFERKLLISSWDCDEDDCVSGDDVRAWIEGDFPNGVEILPFFACEPSRAIRREGRRESRSWWYRRSGRPTARWICRLGRR